ncbi:MAG: PKD domain-containing protein [Candidatus Hodarchaeota archaeon]
MKKYDTNGKLQRVKEQVKLFLGVGTLIALCLMAGMKIGDKSGFLEHSGESLQYMDEINDAAIGFTLTEVVSTESTNESYNPAIAVDGSGNIHVVWDEWTNYGGSGEDIDIFYKRWNASTSGWTITEVVSTESTQSSQFPSIAVDSDGNAHVAWQESIGGRNIYYKHWNATTGNWTWTEAVSTETSQAWYPSIAVDGSGNVHVVWHDDTNFVEFDNIEDIMYKNRNATGSWTYTELVSNGSTGYAMYPSIAVDDSQKVHVVWYDSSGPDPVILYKYRNITSGIWSVNETVSNESGFSFNPSIAVDGSGNVHVAWGDSSNYSSSGDDYDILYKRWNETAGSWTTTEVVSTESTSNSDLPSIAADGSGNVHVTWEDLSNYSSSGTDKDIFYKFWNATDDSWTVTRVVSTESTNFSFTPSIAVDITGTAHMAWNDFTDYLGSGMDRDIFYKKTINVPGAPFLQSISPDPDDDGTIDLDWNDVPGATVYHVFRDTSNITSVSGLTPIMSVSDSNHSDSSTANSTTYFYAIVAGNATGNSSISNCESVTVEIPEEYPDADFTADRTTIEEGETVHFFYTGSLGNEPASFQWNFGDGTQNSTEENATHQYLSPSTFTVTLTVIDADGDPSTEIKVDFIVVTPTGQGTILGLRNQEWSLLGTFMGIMNSLFGGLIWKTKRLKKKMKIGYFLLFAVASLAGLYGFFYFFI